MTKVNFTAQRIRSHSCPDDKSQSFLWDANTPGLGLRVTPKGQPTFIYQGNFGGKSLRLKIGSPKSWSIPEAQTKSRELRRLTDQGIDPRQQLKKSRLANQNARKLDGLGAREAWRDYLQARKAFWGDRHYADHVAHSRNLFDKREGYQDGILTPLLRLPLSELNRTALESWAVANAQTRPTVARLAWRCLKAFLNWAIQQDAYVNVFVGRNPAISHALKEILGRPNAKRDAIQREQLPLWFAATNNLANPIATAYLQTLLLTGARPSEILKLKWSDVDFKWSQMTIGDKVEGLRTIPLTKHITYLLNGLPKSNDWVFTGRKDAPFTGTIAALKSVCEASQIQGLTRTGLRRSFRTLSEWVDAPVGVVAQIMGHKPSAIAEKHYTVRPLDLLRHHHQKIEDWIIAAGLGRM